MRNSLWCWEANRLVPRISICPRRNEGPLFLVISVWMLTSVPVSVIILPRATSTVLIFHRNNLPSIKLFTQYEGQVISALNKYREGLTYKTFCEFASLNLHKPPLSSTNYSLLNEGGVQRLIIFIKRTDSISFGLIAYSLGIFSPPWHHGGNIKQDVCKLILIINLVVSFLTWRLTSA